MINDKKKIFILILPGTGHLNPLSGLVTELVEKRNCQVIFYAYKEQKEKIEKLGAEFRMYKFFKPEDLINEPLDKCTLALSDFLIHLMNTSSLELPFLLKDVLRDRPDLIIIDHLWLPAKYMVKILEKNYLKGISDYKPKILHVFTCFASKKNLYPTQDEIRHLVLDVVGQGTKKSFAKLFYKQILFSLRHDIKVVNTFDLIYNFQCNLNITTVIPELQPYSEQFGENHNFIGSSVNHQTRKTEITDKNLEKLMNDFKPINPIENFFDSHNFNNSDKKLIYASLGTVFNNNYFIYDKIIDSIRLLNETNDSYQYLFSLGDSLAVFKQRIENEGYKLPENILLMKSVPQIEVLERASLFITHAGMNSASEAIFYGVPVICLPIDIDQPLVAKRLADDLKLGLRLNPFSLNIEELKNGIEAVLNDKSYLERMINMSKISRKYNSSLTGADLIMVYLK